MQANRSQVARACALACALQPACGSDDTTAPGAATVDIGVAMTSSAQRARVGETVGYTVSVTNAGPADAVPVGFTVVLTSQDDLGAVAGSGWRCSPHTGNFVTCELTRLPARGSSALTMNRKALQPGLLLNTVTVEAPGQADTNPGNNRATIAVQVD